MIFGHLLAVSIEQLEAGSLEGCGEESGGPALASSRESLQGEGVQSEVVHRRRAKVRHARDAGAVMPSLEQSWIRVQDPKPIGRDARLGDQPGRDMHAVDPAADDQPVNVHTRASFSGATIAQTVQRDLVANELEAFRNHSLQVAGTSMDVEHSIATVAVEVMVMGGGDVGGLVPIGLPGGGDGCDLVVLEQSLDDPIHRTDPHPR